MAANLFLSIAEYEMSEVMVITGTNKATFEGRPSALSDIASVGNGVHSRNGSLKGATAGNNRNGLKCRCMAVAATGNGSTENGVTEEATSSGSSEKESTAQLSSPASPPVPPMPVPPMPVKKEHKATQTVLSTVNGGINGNHLPAVTTRDVISHSDTDNSLTNQLSI